MTDTNDKARTFPDPAALALDALVWIMADEKRAVRLLDLTGLTPASLRGALSEPATHDAILGFLEGHEPDLIAYAEARGIAPAEIPRARRALS